jgi:hypothetical protein
MRLFHGLVLLIQVISFEKKVVNRFVKKPNIKFIAVANLIQFLGDGIQNYLYRLGRVGEYAGDQWAYYATDADH